MSDTEWLASQFEQHRTRLSGVAFRMLGSRAEADDAVQDAWIRVGRAGSDDVDNMAGWLTTIVARVCLNRLRARRSRPEDLAGVQVPDAAIRPAVHSGPEEQAVLADAVGAALQVVLDTLPPAERLAFVLHDLFAVPFDAIGPLVDRNPAAARQLASRARRKITGASPATQRALSADRMVVDAFFAAARDGDFDGLVAILHPDAVLRSDGGQARPSATQILRGAGDVAGRAILFAAPGADVRPATVNGRVGVVTTIGGVPVAVMDFTVDDSGLIVEIRSIVDPVRLTTFDYSALDRAGCQESVDQPRV